MPLSSQAVLEKWGLIRAVGPETDQRPFYSWALLQTVWDVVRLFPNLSPRKWPPVAFTIRGLMHPCRWGQTPSPPQPCPRSVRLLSRPLSELRPVETRRLDVTPEGFPCAVAMGGTKRAIRVSRVPTRG
jgi:hypothetical protein